MTATGPFVRLLLGLAALLAAAWLALSYHSALLEQQTLGLVVKPKLSASDLDLALRKTRAARAWQPDADPKLAEWAVLLFAKRDREADPLLRQVVHAEPDNAEAWVDVVRSTRDPQFKREAQRRLRVLLPR